MRDTYAILRLRRKHRIDIATGGVGPQATLNRQVASVSLQRHFHRIAGRRWRHCWRHAETAQVTEDGLHRFDRVEVRATSGTASTHKPSHRGRVEIVRAEALPSVVELIASTTTNTGLTVRCELETRSYPKGIK